ncbi:hypothetical protein CCACVL1_18106 [Corchorus capsularis]|uniref:Uncharacterized protein n=1 Tax=Corchorus capsularis TaxID=210143 RepID=A0A1R3HMQ8_COCAP|nr:hypothetical protein CCACVL1_18106 [Corchorus capsularis]
MNGNHCIGVKKKKVGEVKV